MEFKNVGFFKRVVKALKDTEKLKSPILIKEATEVNNYRFTKKAEKLN